MSLDKHQMTAVNAKGRYVLCNSKAGSGKTHTLMNRCISLLNNGVKPDEIMLITFTNKAAGEMKRRIVKMVDVGGQILCGTFHNIALTFLRKYASEVGYDENFSIITPDSGEKKIKDIIKTTDPELKEVITAKKILSHISKSRNNNIDFAEHLESTDLTYGQIERVVAIKDLYQTYRELNGLMDFDDLLDNFMALLVSPKAGKEIVNKFKHILVDEFQDVNEVQHTIVQLLTQNDADDNNLFVVGDPCQAIYGFRGSRIDYILDLVSVYRAQEVNLDYNYRSTQEILDLASEATNGYTSMQAVKGRGNTPAMYVVSGTDKTWENNKLIAKSVVSEIKSLIDAGENPDEIAILIRTTNGSNLLELELNKAKIPYVVRAGFAFFEKAHIKDVISFLSMTVNFKNTEAIERILVMLEGVGKTKVKKFIEEYKSYPKSRDGIIQLMKDIESGKVKIGSKVAQKSIGNFANLLKVAFNNSMVANMNVFLLTFEDYYKSNYIEDWEERIEEVKSLIPIAEDFIKSGASTAEFINSVSIDTSINNKESGDVRTPKVVLSTMHRAKGLEWDNVIICSMEAFTRGNDNYEESTDGFRVTEDQRLLYVAITRAKKKLSIYLSNSDYRGARKNNSNLSYLIRNLTKVKRFRV